MAAALFRRDGWMGEEGSGELEEGAGRKDEKDEAREGKWGWEWGYVWSNL